MRCLHRTFAGVKLITSSFQFLHTKPNAFPLTLRRSFGCHFSSGRFDHFSQFSQPRYHLIVNLTNHRPSRDIRICQMPVLAWLNTGASTGFYFQQSFSGSNFDSFTEVLRLNINSSRNSSSMGRVDPGG